LLIASSAAGRLAVWRLELPREGGVDLEVAQQEGALVKALAPQPSGDFGVALLALHDRQTGTMLPSVYRPPRERASTQSRCSAVLEAPQ
jgi:hypothetical protein